MLIVNCHKNTPSNFENEMGFRYLRDIRRFRVLTEQEQKELLKTIKTGSPEESRKARIKLIESNQRFIASAARHLTNGENFNDLVSEGCIGLDHAIDKFDLTFKQQFITYAAFWINKYMKQYMVETEQMIKPKNANLVDTFSEKFSNRFFMEHGYYPSVEELQNTLAENGINIPKKEDLYKLDVFSIEEADRDNAYGYEGVHGFSGSAKFNDFQNETSTNNISDKIEYDGIKKMVEKVLECLTPTERIVIKKYYGIGCEQEEIALIANSLETTNASINKTLKTAFKKMSDYLIKHPKLRNYLKK